MRTSVLVALVIAAQTVALVSAEARPRGRSSSVSSPPNSRSLVVVPSPRLGSETKAKPVEPLAPRPVAASVKEPSATGNVSAATAAPPKPWCANGRSVGGFCLLH
jgi:hypothetical protein